MTASKPTMAQVAALAGVSTATVRRVLYESGYVKASTREAVLEAVRNTTYRPNAVARGLRTRTSSAIGFLTENELNPFFTKVARAVQAEALRRGYTVLMLNHNRIETVEQRGIDHILDQQVGAVIFCPSSSPEVVRRVMTEGIRVVQLERETVPLGCRILVDAEQGMREAVSHLAGLGHRRIAYIGGDVIALRHEIALDQTNERLRVSAFRNAMASVGLALPDGYIQLGEYLDASGRPSDGVRMMELLLRQAPRPSAVVVGSDFIAAGALQAIHAAGLRVPDDISIIGYDDSIAELLTPPLTTIAQPMDELGRLAVEMALKPIGNPSVEVPTQLKARLVVRNSTSAAGALPN